jgi:hypothetical protein
MHKMFGGIFGYKDRILKNRLFTGNNNFFLGQTKTFYFLKSGILKVQERREFEVLVMMHKIVHKNCPPYLNDLVKFVSDASSRSTIAHKFKLRIPLVRIEAPEGSFL